MKYPYAVIEPHSTQKDVVYFDIYTQYNVSVCIPITGKRDEIRKILNPHYTGEVILHRRVVLQGKDTTLEIERLSYRSGFLYYMNQSMKWKIAFSDGNRKTLEEYDYKLEHFLHTQETDCCVLY